MDIEKIRKKILEYNPQADWGFIERAYRFAKEAHQGQVRHSGEEYISHPASVFKILVSLQMDDATLVAGLLHDVVEDTRYNFEDIKEEFGEEVAILVEGVTKLSKLEFNSKEERQVENLRKMFMAMAKDIRVILIKLADRLHNMRTLRFHGSQVKQKEIARETIEIFAPLAHRLGIFKIKWELEDLSLRYLEPERYYELVEQINMKRAGREAYIQEITQMIEESLEELGIKGEITGRPKNFYSIYKKMIKQKKELDEIYDLMAVRIIVESVKDCYAVLGTVHTLWKPIPGRFKDYIAMPKENMYQSIHTTVIGPGGTPVEIQIRTWEMHQISEYGIAAHWRYKEGKSSVDEFEKKISWLRQMLEWQRELSDVHEFMDSVKDDLLTESVFVFTPRGDVYELLAGACPIDFAYRVHTQVGHQCIGAKVNGKIVPLDYTLKNGDIVEILTLKNSGPSRDWLKIVQTSQAKNRIKQWFKKEKKVENIQKGRELLEKEIKKLEKSTAEIMKNSKLLEAGKKFNYLTLDDIFAAIGDNVITPAMIIYEIDDSKKLVEEKESLSELKFLHKTGPKKTTGHKGVMVKGADDIEFKFAQCCNPLPGDPIIGYITRGTGISVHRADCPNFQALKQQDEERIIEVSWIDEKEHEGLYKVEIQVIGNNRPRFALDVITAITNTKTDISAVNAREVDNGLAEAKMVMAVKNKEDFDYIINKVKRVKGVLEVTRVNPGKEG